MDAVPPGTDLRLRLHRPRPGGRRRRRGLRARARRRVAPAQPRAGMPPRARSDASRTSSATSSGKGDGPDARPRRQHAFRRAATRGVFPLVSMLGDLVPARRRRRARVQAPRRAARRADVLGRRRHVHRRRARGPQPGGRAQGAGGLRASSQPATRTPRRRARQMVNTTSPTASRAAGAFPRRASTARDALARLRRRADGGRAGAGRRRAAGGRGASRCAWTATRRTTTRATSTRSCRREFAHARSDRAARGAAALDGLHAEDRGLRAAAAAEVAAGLARRKRRRRPTRRRSSRASTPRS